MNTEFVTTELAARSPLVPPGTPLFNVDLLLLEDPYLVHLCDSAPTWQPGVPEPSCP